MDSISNGEVPEECLSKAKESSNVQNEKVIAKSKNPNSAGDSLKSPWLDSLKSNSTPILETCVEQPDPEKESPTNSKELKQKEIVQISNVTVSKPPTDSLESVADVSTNVKADSPLDENNKPAITKENGISIGDTLKSGSFTENQKNLTSNREDEDNGNLLGISSSETHKLNSGNLDATSQKNKPSENCDKDILVEIDSSLCAKMTAEKKSLSAFSTNHKNSTTLLGDSDAKTKDVDIAKDSVMEVVEDKNVNVSKNHLMSGGSIISSSDSQDACKILGSSKVSKISDTEKLTNISEKLPKITSHILPSCDDSKKISILKKNPDSSDQPINFASIQVEQSSKNESESNSRRLSADFVDLAANKSCKETNPLEKLDKHLNSIGVGKDQVHNHSQKSDISALNNASTPIIVAEKSHCHATCNKENDCSHPHERLHKESSDSFVFANLTNEETGFPEAFTGLVTIGKYISVKGDFTLRSTEALVESPSLVAPYLLKEPDTFPSKDKDSKSDVKDFFHSAAGEILIGIGLSRVNEWFHRDMTRIKKRQMKRAGKTPELEEELAMHENYYSEAKKANSVYSFSYKVCKTCGFTTESSVIMEGHLLVPHVTPRREYECSFCDFINRDPKVMLEHMENKHHKMGRIQPPVLFFECPYCTFESNSKVKLNNHLPKCQRYFDHGINQAPPKDFEFPALTPKPITVAVVKAYEKSLGSMQRGRGRPKKDHSDSMHVNQFSPIAPLAPNHVPSFRASSNSPLADSLSMQNQIIPPIQMPNMNIRPAHSNAVGQLRPGISSLHMPPSNRFFQVVNPAGQIMPMMGNNHLVTSPSQFPFSTNLDNSAGKKAHPTPYFNSMFGSGMHQQNSSKNMSSVTITPLPKLQGPYPVPMAKQSTATGSTSLQSNSLVVCEICDGYIKDLEQLRTHMQLIHKVKIHPKMLVSRPPLNCQKCQWRFFTDQGLERHLLGAHGLVTSNMQELANKSKDAGCCTICGRVFASKLVSHMNQVHKVTLKPAHLSYKCTVCSATFNLYRLFENHVYLVHSGAAKRSADGRSSPSKKLKSSSDLHPDGDSSNHKDKRSSSKDAEDENVKKCNECGKEMKSKGEKCEKCLKSDDLVPGNLSTKTLKDELRSKDKAIEKAIA